MGRIKMNGHADGLTNMPDPPDIADIANPVDTIDTAGAAEDIDAIENKAADGEGQKEPVIFGLLRTEVPNPRQREFFLSRARHIAYGGARGGGKSWAMRRKFVLLAMRWDGLRLLLLRRTMPELRENHILPLLRELDGYAEYRSAERAFIFPNGSRLCLGYCANDADCLRYQGQEYEVIGFEEATNFREEWIVFISTCLRTTRTDFSPRIYYTCNPGGVSHDYIKRLFVTRSYVDGERAEDYAFIPARVYDNPALMQADPEYIRRLQALPPHKRRAHLEGDWDIYEGQVFEEFRNDPEHYADRRWTHVIDPFDPPDSWSIWRSFDFGYARPFSAAWWAVDHDGRLYRLLELYGCAEGQANVGVKWTPEQIFGKMREIECEHAWLRGKRIFGVADPSIWDGSRGESIAETAERAGIYFEKGDNKRIPGWMQLHYRLRFDEEGIPMMYFFKGCAAAIRTLPLMQYDAHFPEDVDSSLEDHAPDEIRYICQMKPIAPERPVPPPKRRQYNPLE